MTYRVGIIGTGADPQHRDRDGFAMAYRHAPGYARLDACEVVACADIVPEHAEAFAQHFDLDHWYDSHQAMLDDVDLDIVSICVPPGAHADLVTDCAERGDLAAIHCEKPMATTWGDCRSMVDASEANDVQLTIGHQRRFAAPVRAATDRLESGVIGELSRLEWSEANLFDAGSHLFDLCDHFTGGARPAWALAGVATDPDNRWFGALNDVQAIATWGYDDGTLGVASTGEDDRPTAVEPYLRVVGTEGTIEIDPPDGPPLRIETGDGWRPIDTDGETIYRPATSLARSATNRVLDAMPGVATSLSGPPSHFDRAIEHVIESLTRGTEPVIAGRRALRGTELIFACYESARRQNRVDLPLSIEDNPLETMVEKATS
ncbi:MAG: Gfo/Idh/MocA family protein [Halobacteriota archaeon]